MRASFFFSPLNRYRFRLLSKNWRNGNNIDAMALPAAVSREASSLSRCCRSLSESLSALNFQQRRDLSAQGSVGVQGC